MTADRERTIDPIDAFLTFLRDNDITTPERLAEYEHIEVVAGNNGAYSYVERKRREGTENPYVLPFGFDISDYLGWADLASFFDPKFHKRVLLRNEDKEKVVKCFDSWLFLPQSSDGFPFKKIKRPVDEYRQRPYGVFIPDKYVVNELD